MSSDSGHVRRAWKPGIREQVWDKTSGACWYCGTQIDGIANLTIDHVQPVALGGTDDLANLVPCCLSCNCSKGARDLPTPAHERVYAPREIRLPGEGYRGYRVVTAPEGHWTAYDAMQELGVPYAVINRWARSGAITTIRLGSKKNSPRAFRQDEMRELARKYRERQRRPPP